jgi:hypothetical protein
VIHFAREPLTDALWAEAMPLLQAHKDEIAHYPDLKLEPDIALYQANDAAGVLRCFTARMAGVFSVTPARKLNDGESFEWCESVANPLVGYALYFVRANPHYKSSVQAVQDVIYLDPSVRGGTGYKFIAWCDAQLASEGVQAVYHHVKAAHDFGKLLQRQGYELVDLIYAKRLDTEPASVSARLEAMDEVLR